MENILITGGAGYKEVGLTTKLLELGYKITVLDNFMYGPKPLIHLSIINESKTKNSFSYPNLLF